MALETSTLVDGAWTTRTLDVNSVLQHYEQQDKAANAKLLEVEKAPVYGLLTQTVIESPVVHWILPVRLRSAEKNDVAFIGDNFIQIRELRPDGHLCDIIRKADFGSRIRNARVVGSMRARSREQIGGIPDEQMSLKDDDVDMGADEVYPNSHQPSSVRLPPQFIVLALESGDSIFLVLRQSQNGEVQFATTRRRVSKAMLNAQPGMHLAVNPSSRYMAVGCSEGLFAIYALHSRDELNQQYIRGEGLSPVASERYIFIHGVIHKMEFLYPSADDEEHVILLLLIVRGGRIRMVLYEWETGGDLREVRTQSKRGHQLADSNRMPLLLIPLTIRSSFLLVSDIDTVLCKDILQGPPLFVPVDIGLDPPTPLHHGLGPPLWTSWTRPLRLPYHTASLDDIYIAREDGVVRFIEIDSEDDIKAHFHIGNFECNNGTALASLEYQISNNSGKTGDLLITGGDSCAGGTYLVRARQPPVFVESVPNWSPSIDFVSTARSQSRDYAEPQSGRKSMPRPDRIFACTGKGPKGAITEFRYGLEANLGLEVEYSAPVMRAWELPVMLATDIDDDGSLFLLSLGNCSALLQLSSDATEIVEVKQAATSLDLGSRTIAASTHRNNIIQVTEGSIVFTNFTSTLKHDGESLLGSAANIDDAVIYEDVVLFSVHQGRHETQVKILTPNASFQVLGRFLTHITCLAMCMVDRTLCAVIAAWSSDSVTLTFHPIGNGPSQIWTLPAFYGDENIYLEAFISIAVTRSIFGHLTLLCGTRNGFVVTLNIIEDTFQIESSRCDRFGATPAIISRDDRSESHDSFFVCCDSKVFVMKVGMPQTSTALRGLPYACPRIDQIWLTNATNPTLQQPSIVSVTGLRHNLSSDAEGGRLLLVASSQLLLAGLGYRSKAVPRRLPIGGTPSRILYSQSLGVLIVAASVAGQSTLLFIDPDTGYDLSKPIDKQGTAVGFVSGLGVHNEKVLGLLEWPYVKDGKTWQFIIVCTTSGRLLIISAEKEEVPKLQGISSPDSKAPGKENVHISESGTTSGPKIRYWTRHKFKCQRPVYSVVGCADGLFYCSGNILRWETLDVTDRKFKKVAEYELPSPAVSLSVDSSIVYALTSEHSLEALRISISGAGQTSGSMVRVYSDQVARAGLHHKEVTVGRPVLLVSDKDCTVTGLWASDHTKAETLITVFETELPSSIVRFRSAKCRPTWDANWSAPLGQARATNATNNHQGIGLGSRHGREGLEIDMVVDCASKLDIIPSTRNHGEILGLAIDGSLTHCTVLGISAWRFLRFLLNLALQSPIICPFTYDRAEYSLEPSLEPKIMMQIDGDVLKRCLGDRRLEELLRIGQETEDSAGVYLRFCELLEELHGSPLGSKYGTTVYVEHAYAYLEFYLRPVL